MYQVLCVDDNNLLADVEFYYIQAKNNKEDGVCSEISLSKIGVNVGWS